MAKKVNIKGVIIPNDEQWIYDLFDIEATSPGKVISQIEDAKGKGITVEINSGGGSVFAGSEIYTMIKSYEGNVVVRIVGIAASAASVIAMAGDTVQMSPTAQIMIHNVSARAEGDHNDMTHTAGILKTANETIANAYRIKSGMDQEEILQMMEYETWLSPAKAKEYGLIDEVLFEKDIQLVANYEGTGTLPKATIENIRNEVALKKEQDNIKKAEVRLLNLKRKGLL